MIGLLPVLAVGSLALFVVSLLLIPIVVARLPADTFARYASPPPAANRPLWYPVVLLLKNLLGLVLLVAGLAMLFLPGQGLLTILLALMLLSFPGKRRLVLWLICQPKLQRSMDWLRLKQKKAPFTWPGFPS